MKFRDYTFLAETPDIELFVNARPHLPWSDFHRHVSREPVMLNMAVVYTPINTQTQYYRPKRQIRVNPGTVCLDSSK